MTTQQHTATEDLTGADERVSICQQPSGVCPEHGDRLIWTPISQVTFCGGPGCQRRWSDQRAARACTEPATKLVATTDNYGFETDMPYASPSRSETTTEMGAGHALVA